MFGNCYAGLSHAPLDYHQASSFQTAIFYKNTFNFIKQLRTLKNKLKTIFFKRSILKFLL